MDLRFAWGLALSIAAGAMIASWVYTRRARATRRGRAPVANSSVLTRLPEYARALKLHRLRLMVLALAGLLVLLGGSLASARPQSTWVYQPNQRNRDIMLCLDVSPSMNKHDAALVKSFRDLVKGFRGERVGMVIFNTNAVSYFPLTDDYDYMEEQLATAQKALEAGFDENFYAGTEGVNGTSLIGDGLASCALAFDQQDRVRTRSIIIATDNRLAGMPLYSWDEAIQLAMDKQIRVYGINPSPSFTMDASDMETGVVKTQGAYFKAADTTTINTIVQKVLAQEATASATTPRAIYSDAPTLPLALSGVGVLGLIVASRRWR